MQVWAESKVQPGLFTGSTGVKPLSVAELSSGCRTWPKKVNIFFELKYFNSFFFIFLYIWVSFKMYEIYQSCNGLLLVFLPKIYFFHIDTFEWSKILVISDKMIVSKIKIDRYLKNNGTSSIVVYKLVNSQIITSSYDNK